MWNHHEQLINSTQSPYLRLEVYPLKLFLIFCAVSFIHFSRLSCSSEQFYSCCTRYKRRNHSNVSERIKIDEITAILFCASIFSLILFSLIPASEIHSNELTYLEVTYQKIRSPYKQTWTTGVSPIHRITELS